MKHASLHVRLSAAALISILVALTISGLFLNYLFERHVTRRVDQELSVYIKQLAATLEIGTDGKPSLISQLADPRFQKPFSGLYWQIEDGKKSVLHSRSLWDQTLALPPFNAKHPAPTRREITGPEDETLIIRARVIFFETGNSARPFRLSAAINKNEINAALTQFSRDLMIALGLLALALLFAAALQIHIGLRPLNQIRQRVNDIRNGETSRLEGEFPKEVELLVGEVNALLTANQEAVQRARDSAADLAHGLKTPLAVLQAESHALAEHQQTQAADEITAQIEQMRRRIDHHLAIVRMRGPSGGSPGRTDAKIGFVKIVKAMQTMPRGDELIWSIKVPDELGVAIDTQDFFEVFGNLLDNARKWASHEIHIGGQEIKGEIMLSVQDDGPGIPNDKINKVLQRGRRLDEQKTGTGLGLPIAKKVLETYNARLVVKNCDSGGTCICITFPHSSSQT